MKREIWTITGGALMTLCGIVALCVPTLMASVLSLVLGIVSVLCGACLILSFWFLKRTVGGGLLLADGIIMGVLGLLLLINQWVYFIDMNVLFTALLVLIGTSLIVFAVQVKNYRVRKWWLLLVLGGGSMAVGLFLQIVPSFIKLATSLTVGILLIVGGVCLTVGTLMANRNREKVITVREKDIEFIPDETPNTNLKKDGQKTTLKQTAAKTNGGKDKNDVG